MLFLLRWLFWLTTFVTVLAAVVTATGRVLVPWLDELEPQVNALLEARGVELRGLKGDWRGLNPIIRVDAVRFNGGHARQFELEIDLLESALHSALVARRLRVDAIDVSVVRNVAGVWQLGGVPAQKLPFSIDALLAESDELSIPEVDLRIYQEISEPGTRAPDSLAEESGAATEGADPLRLMGNFHLVSDLRNLRDRHIGSLLITPNDSACDECALKLHFDFEDSILGIGGDGDASLAINTVEIDPGLGLALGAAGGVIEDLQLRWQMRDGIGRGMLRALASDLTLANGRLANLNLEALVNSEEEEWRLRMATLRAAIGGGASAKDLDVVGLDATVTWSEDSRTVEFFLPSLDVGPTVDVLRSAFGGRRVVADWIDGLQPVGRLDALQGRMDLSTAKVVYSAAAVDVAVENFKGVPMARRADVTLVGNERSVQVAIDDDDVELGFHEVLDRATEFQSAQGTVLVYFGAGYLGIRSTDLEIVAGTATGRGGFVVARPVDRSETHLAILADVVNMAVEEVRDFIPNKLSAELIGWLHGALRTGRVDGALVAYQGHTRVIPGKVMRHAEILGRVSDAEIQYHADWPVAQELTGSVRISLSGTHVALSEGRIGTAGLQETLVFVPRIGGVANVDGNARLGTADALDMIRTTPLRGWLPQVEEDWTGNGELDVAFDLSVPLKDADVLDIDLELDLRDVTLGLGAIGLTATGLSGQVAYQHPYVVTALPMQGELFGRPATFAAETVDGAIRLAIDSRMSVPTLLEWLSLPDHELASGESDFAAVFLMRPDAVPRLEVESDLQGIAVNLPAPFRKQALEPRPTHLELDFASRYTGMAFDWASRAEGWVHLGESGGLTGFVRLGPDGRWIPPQQHERSELMVVGRLDSADLAAWSDLLPLVQGEGPSQTWAVPGLEIGKAYFGDVSFDDLLVDGGGSDGDLRIAVDGPQIKGRVNSQAGAQAGDVMAVTVDFISFPATEEGAGDPLDGLDLSGVPDLDVRVGDVRLGDESYGNWSMQIRRAGTGFTVSNVVADIKGLHIESTGPGRWDPEGDDRSYFVGSIAAGNLAEVLPQWDYAASIESQKADLTVRLNWPGSPLNFSLWNASGSLDVAVEQGRFLDVQSGSGTVRMFGLFNLAALAKRMTLDFSDVFGKGISFDEVTASTELVNGLMTFTEPMLVEGTGGSFRLAGTVDLDSGSLDNEMVVTLPVSASLPWYAAYLSVFANPIIGGAVFVGERLFRDQIDSFSSAKYKIDGTLDDPNVTFVQVFSSAKDANPTAGTGSDAKDS